MDLARQLHDTAVKLYESNRGDEAYEMFQDSLQTMLLSSGQPLSMMHPTACHALMGDPFVQRAIGKDFFLNTGVPLRPEDDHQLPRSFKSAEATPCTLRESEEVTYMCTDVFRLPTLSYCNEVNYNISVAVAYYNMAVVLHRGQVSYSRQSLERALMLYCRAGRLLGDEILDPSIIRQNKVLSKLYCAVLNNSGYLLHQTGSYEWSKAFFLQLAQYIKTLDPAENTSEQREREDFQLNVILFSRNIVAAGAA